MSNKNQRIASILNNIAAEFQQITKILLEKESVQSPMAILTEGMSKPLSDSAGRGTWGQALADSNKGLSDGDKRTAAINEQNRQTVKQMEEDGKVPENIWNSPLVKQIDCNSTTIFYKRVKGVHRGSILTVDRKTKQITDHKYLVTVPLSSQLCLVSKDQDGLDYVANYVRPSIVLRVEKLNKGLAKNKQVSYKLVRYYRPGDQRYSPNKSKNHPRKTHCAVYLSERYYTTAEGQRFR